MIDGLLNTVKKLIPKKIFTWLQPGYHFVMGFIAALWYRWPSDKLIVVGVTGTTGKTTTVYMITEVLKSAGYRVGYISTALFGDGEIECLNNKKMTMLGRFFTQKMLRKMVSNHCDVAIIETTSQGIVQFRHRFINYDVLLFTGLYPEHIEAHGGFENYKKSKGKLFAHLKKCKKKKINGKKIVKTSIINADDEYAKYFSHFWAKRKITFGQYYGDIQAKNILAGSKGINFDIDNVAVHLQLLGTFNVINALAAACVARSLDVSMDRIKDGLESIASIPGRLEKIDGKIIVNGGEKNFVVIVDYAFEPNAMTKLYETVASFDHGKIIHVLGSAGGGRDKARRKKLGKIAGDHADYIIITNEDPYDEDPMDIINEVAKGIEGKKEEAAYWKILDRRQAIAKALQLAENNDVVLVTGKGSEQGICVANSKMIPWDDRDVVKEELLKIQQKNSQ